MTRSVRNVRRPTSGRLPKPIPITHIIPPAFGQIYKVEIITSSETLNVTDVILEAEYTEGVTGTIGDFDITLDNSNKEFSQSIELWNQVKIYMDYGSTASTHVFTGFIERPSKFDHKIQITGRGSASQTTGVNVTYTATDMARKDVLIAIIEKYFDGKITTNNVEEDSELISVNFFEVPFWEVVEKLCNDGGRDAYVDQNSDFNYFIIDSRTNSTDAISEDVNLIKTGDFSPDLEQSYNKIRVYGANIQGIPIIATKNDTNFQDLYDIKTLKINDESIITESQAEERAEFELLNNKTPPTVGSVVSFLLPTLKPGEKLFIANPQNNIEPNYYKTYKFTHKFGSNIVPTTEVTIQKERLNVPNVFKKRINFETGIFNNPNPNELDTSLIYDFSTSEGTFNNTQRVLVKSGDGNYVLKTISGDSGTWTSPNVSFFPKNITHLEFRITGDSLGGTPPEGTKIEYSLDGGITFRTWGTSTVEVTTKGQLQIRVNLSSSETQVKAVGALYSLSS